MDERSIHVAPRRPTSGPRVGRETIVGRGSDGLDERNNCPASRTHRGLRPGLTLIEIVISAFLIAVLVVASLNAAGVRLRAQQLLNDRARAHLLAEEIATEIAGLPYEDPDQPPMLGVEPGENAKDRQTFDDVDDYADWPGTPPSARDGSTLNVPGNWSRGVSIEFVTPDDLNVVSNTDTGIKRISVTVKRVDAVLAEVTAIATVHSD